MRKQQIQPVEINLENMLLAADRLEDVLTYQSDVKGIGYAASKDELLIITNNRGYLRVGIDAIENIIFEISSIAEDIRERRRN